MPKSTFRWKVYILECKNGLLYTGSTTDLKRRFKEHQKGSARFTKANPPVRIIHSEKFKNRSSAQKREAAIKRLPKKKKLQLANGDL